MAQGGRRGVLRRYRYGKGVVRESAGEKRQDKGDFFLVVWKAVTDVAPGFEDFLPRTPPSDCPSSSPTVRFRAKWDFVNLLLPKKRRQIPLVLIAHCSLPDCASKCNRSSKSTLCCRRAFALVDEQSRGRP